MFGDYSSAPFFFYYDRFGDDHLVKVSKIILRWSYYLRFKYYRIIDSRVDKHAREPNSLLRCIDQAVSPNEILAFIPPTIK